MSIVKPQLEERNLKDHKKLQKAPPKKENQHTTPKDKCNVFFLLFLFTFLTLISLV